MPPDALFFNARGSRRRFWGWGGILTTLIFVFWVFLSTDSHAFGTQGCDSSTNLFLRMEGADAATSFPEEDCDGTGASVWTANGDAQVDTANPLFGSTLLLDGVGDFLSTPDSTEWNLGSSNFTLDFWIRFNGALDAGVLIGQWVGASKAWMAFFDGINVLTFYWTADCANTNAANFSWTPSVNTWYHVAFSRTQVELKAFVDGVQIGSDYSGIGSTAICNGTSTLRIGQSNDGDPWGPGQIDEMRLSKGIARYPGNFERPTSPYCQGCEMVGAI